MRYLLATLPILGLGACPPADNVTFSGTVMERFFPFDGLRTWEFINSDPAYSYKLVGQMREDVESDGSRNIYTVDYFTDCVAEDPSCTEGEVLRTVRWSSSGDGVFIYGIVTPTQEVDFDPPLQVFETKAKVDDQVVTETGGGTWTSTLIRFESCPVRMNVDWNECAHFTLEVDGDDPGLVGDYWAILNYNVVAIELADETGRWELSKQVCEGECDGHW